MSDSTSKPAGDSNGTAGKESLFPTTFPALQKRTQTCVPWPQRFFRELLGDISRRDVAIGLLFIAVIALLLARVSFTRIPAYRVGEHAGADLITSDDIIVSNQRLTRLQQEGAQSQVPAVFDYYPNVLKTVQFRLHQFFFDSRALLGHFENRTIKPPALAQFFQSEFGQPPSPRLLDALTANGFSDSLERQLGTALQQIMAAGIINTHEVVEATTLSSGVVLRNMENNSETPLSIAPAGASLAGARDRLGDQLRRLEELPREVVEEWISNAQNLLSVNALYNQHETLRRRQSAAEAISPVQIHLPRGTLLLRAGQPISAETVEALNAMRALEAKYWRSRYFLGLFLAVLFFVFFIWRFLLQRQTKTPDPRREFLLIFSCFVIMLLLAKVMFFTFEMIRLNFASAPFNDPLSSKLAVPFAAGALLMALLLDGNAAMICAIVFSLFAGYMGRSPLLAIYSLASSLAAIYAARQYRDRNAVIKASMLVGLSNLLIVGGLSLLGERLNDWKILLFDFGNAMVGGFFVAGVVSLLLPLFENAFDICTDVRLLELSNLNLPVLRRLAAEAPGTYHHSILVGILAEAAAEAIGANALLARVACLYHDVGKIIKPTYYIENSKEATERHEQLAPGISSLVIIDHVKEGMELGKKIHLPRRVMEVIPQHHGTSVVTYFYHKAKSEADPDEIGITEEQFRYPGPRPNSKEAALIMLADSIEAAARTVEHPDSKKLQNVVDRMVSRFMNDHQLDESQLMLNEIQVAKQAFARALAGIYHSRIAYPGYDFSQPAASVASS